MFTNRNSVQNHFGNAGETSLCHQIRHISVTGLFWEKISRVRRHHVCITFIIIVRIGHYTWRRWQCSIWILIRIGRRRWWWWGTKWRRGRRRRRQRWWLLGTFRILITRRGADRFTTVYGDTVTLARRELAIKDRLIKWLNINLNYELIP